MVKKVNAIQTTGTSNLVKKKKDSDTIIGKIEKKTLDHDNGKYTTTQEINKLMEYNSAARLKQANLASKNDITDLVKNKF